LKPSTRIAINTAATYTRSILAVGLALFSSRWVLNALGVTDFGLYNVVGSLIIFLTFFNTVMAASASRHFAYAIGQDDGNEVNRWFNTSLSIHLFLPALLILLGWPIAEYVVRNVLTIPPARVETCVLVFRISLISAFVNMAAIPFVAMFNAKQCITEVAFWGLLQAIFAFILAWILTQVPFDRLMFYAFGMVLIHVLTAFAKIFRALILFKECRLCLAFWFDVKRIKELCSFAIWSLIGSLGTTFRDQGSAVLLNMYFGPSLNSAFAIAKQVSTQANQLSSSMLIAFLPEITASEGRGDRCRVLSLSHSASKIGTILVLLLAIPLIAEMDSVLRFWLGNPPEYTALFCQLVLGTFLIDRLATGYWMAITAHGKIAAYQATVGGVHVLTLPLAWLFLYLGYPPFSVCIAFIITAVICTIGRVIWLKILFEEPMCKWLKKIVLPCILVAATASLASLLPRFAMLESFFRFMLSIFLGVTITCLSTWIIALDSGERSFIREICKRVLLKK